MCKWGSASRLIHLWRKCYAVWSFSQLTSLENRCMTSTTPWMKWSPCRVLTKVSYFQCQYDMSINMCSIPDAVSSQRNYLSSCFYITYEIHRHYSCIKNIFIKILPSWFRSEKQKECDSKLIHVFLELQNWHRIRLIESMSWQSDMWQPGFTRRSSVLSMLSLKKRILLFRTGNVFFSTFCLFMYLFIFLW